MTAESRKSRAILITGCSSGIGLCVADGLKQRGYRVLASARQAADVQKLQARGHETVQLDLADPHSIQQAVESVLDKTGGELYGLFNNGGFGQAGAVEDLSREAIRRQFETNVFGWIELTNLLLPVMRRQGFERIIQNSSVLGLAAMPYRGAYNASKFAIEGFSDTLRLELQGTDIFVSLIQPGPIESRFRANSLKVFLAADDHANSVHRQHYQAVLSRLENPAPASRFTLGPEHVLKRVILALESAHPKARYPVTVPTYLFSGLKRILPTSLLDRILRSV
ncbi:MAG: SDR family NAD(P)-dependent oxidoreductase [Gammaproteobacteria bacterium]|nr:SDR family NAD(P)-dependent oxidoreductase [Gammaproteobacteria bacterium]